MAKSMDEKNRAAYASARVCVYVCEYVCFNVSPWRCTYFANPFHARQKFVSPGYRCPIASIIASRAYSQCTQTKVLRSNIDKICYEDIEDS